MADSMGSRIRLTRRIANLPQHVIARKIGRSPAWLSLVEQDALTPTVTDIENIAAALDISVTDLIGRGTP